MLQKYHFKNLKSSQDKAWEILDSDGPLDFVVSADSYEALRGRRGRVWHFDSESSFCFSLALKVPSNHLSALSVMTAYLCRKVISNPELLIKWPNDLFFYDQKVGGILIESRALETKSFQVVIGIGINQFNYESYRGIQKRLDLESFSEALYAEILEYFTKDFEFYREAVEATLWRRNQSIRLKIDENESSFILRGLDGFGRLLTEQEKVLSLHSNGEIVAEDEIP